MKTYPTARITPLLSETTVVVENLFQIGDANLIGGSALGPPFPTPFVQPRTGGEFGGRAFYLPHGYDWTLARDSGGFIVLIPSREKE